MSERLLEPGKRTTAIENQLGQRLRDHRGFEYMYVKAAEAVGANDVVTINQVYAIHKLDTAALTKFRRIGVALDGAFAANQHGWVCIYGVGQIKVKASCAANAQLYTSATAGSMDDAATSHEGVKHIYLSTARGGTDGLAPAVWHYPDGS